MAGEPVNNASKAGWLLLGIAACFGAWQAFAMRWLCDDAFITYRYAVNLAEGLGLVFNAEERVEGYSNFTWTLLCAAAAKMGRDPVAFSQHAGIACFVLCGLALAWAGRRLLPGRGALPVAATCFLLHHHSQSFSTCGLETALFQLCTVVLVGIVGGATSPRAWAAAGAVAAFTAMTRPDGAILAALAAGAAAWQAWRSRSLAPFAAYAIPSLALFGSFLAWRYGYYGDFVPNTFHAKSAGDAYASQGLRYVALYLEAYWVLVPAVLGTVFLLLAPRAARGPAGPAEPQPWTWRWLAAVILAYGAFVLWVGGDFMFARFLLPVTPLLYLVVELLARRWLAPVGQGATLAVFAAATLGWSEHEEMRGLHRELDGVTEEREQYPRDKVAAERALARRVREALGPEGARVVFFGSQAMFVHEARFPYALEGAAGLTDRTLATMELPERGRIGHEKSILMRPEYLFERRVQLWLGPRWGEVEPWRQARLFGMPVLLVHWDQGLMDRMKGVDGIEFTDIRTVIDQWVAGAGGRDRAALQAEFEAFQRFYFLWNQDPQRLAAAQRVLAGG